MPFLASSDDVKKALSCDNVKQASYFHTGIIRTINIIYLSKISCDYVKQASNFHAHIIRAIYIKQCTLLI
jgi:hypothetical protein